MSKFPTSTANSRKSSTPSHTPSVGAVAARYGYKEQPSGLAYAKKGYHGRRYTCVNLQNRDTVEFCMFHGTLKPGPILATPELLDLVCNRAVYLTDDELKAVPWTSFAARLFKDR